MKRILVVAILALISLTGFSQKGTVYTVAADTLIGAETVNFVLQTKFYGQNLLTIEALCTDVGGTPDGTLILEGSLDGTSYETITSTSGRLYAWPNDTLTIVAGAVVTWVVEDTPWVYYRVQGGGTADDSTLVNIKYIFK